MTEPLKGLTQEETESLNLLFALLGDGRTKYGKKVRGYLDGTDGLEEMPATRKGLDRAIKGIKGKETI